MNQRRTFFAWRSSERLLVILCFPPSAEPTSASFKSTIIGGGGKPGKGENSDFDLRKPEVEGKDKEVR